MSRYYNKTNSFDFGNFTITRREIIVSISIIALLLLFGVLISSNISEYQMDKNEIYNKAVKIEKSDLFKYGMDTNVGNAFVYGDLKAEDTVTYPEIGGEYIYVEKVEEHYNRHTRNVTKTRTNSKGKTETYTEKEVYYSWDYHDSWEQHSKDIQFCGVTFPYGKIDTPSKKYIGTHGGGGWSNVRFIYYGTGTKFTGTIFAYLKDSTIPNGTCFYENRNIEDTVNMLESKGSVVVFWFLWIILICGAVFAFFYYENTWLE